MKRRRKYWFRSRKGKNTKMCLLCCYGKIWRPHIWFCAFYSAHPLADICDSFHYHKTLCDLFYPCGTGILVLLAFWPSFRPASNKTGFIFWGYRLVVCGSVVAAQIPLKGNFMHAFLVNAHWGSYTYSLSCSIGLHVERPAAVEWYRSVWRRI